MNKLALSTELLILARWYRLYNQGVTYEVPCEVYKVRKILVYEKNGKDLVKEVSIDCDWRYRTELAPGFYVIDISQTGVDHSFEVPAEIEIQSSLTVRVDIDIDTGIR